MIRALLAAVVALALLPGAAPSHAAQDETLVAASAPAITGAAQVAGRLRASSGTWEVGGVEAAPADLELSFRWHRDGRPIKAATTRRYRPVVADLGHRLSVRVVATDAEGRRAAALSAATAAVGPGTLVLLRRPSVSGAARYRRTLSVGSGRWSRAPRAVRYQWLREGRPIRGATRARYRIAPADVGRRLRVRVRVTRPGFRFSEARTARRSPVRHRVERRRVVRYHVETRGQITASRAQFRAQAAQTLRDARGWRGGGVEFRQVARGGSMTLVLAAAPRVPSFSSDCSAQWSCRVGRYVVINQMRWQRASVPWNAAGRSRRDYRHLVVNHEVGHFLGRAHAGCSGRGRAAPVMMAQSKGTGGCRFNPWPTLSEQSR